MSVNLNQAKQALKARETAILKLDAKCEQLNDLSRTLLSALRSALEYTSLNYDDRKELKEQTKSMCISIDEHVTLANSIDDSRFEGAFKVSKKGTMEVES